MPKGIKSAVTTPVFLNGKSHKLIEGAEVPAALVEYVTKHKPDWIQGSKANKEGFRPGKSAKKTEGNE